MLSLRPAIMLFQCLYSPDVICRFLFDLFEQGKECERDDSDELWSHRQKKDLRLQNDDSTRSNSGLEMMESLLRIRLKLSNALKLIGKHGLYLKVQKCGVVEKPVTFL